MKFTCITIDPAVCAGKPCIRRLRFSVARLLGLLAAGETRDSILKAYPYLESGDINEALRYAACLANDQMVELAAAASVPDDWRWLDAIVGKFDDDCFRSIAD